MIPRESGDAISIGQRPFECLACGTQTVGLAMSEVGRMLTTCQAIVFRDPCLGRARRVLRAKLCARSVPPTWRCVLRSVSSCCRCCCCCSVAPLVLRRCPVIFLPFSICSSLSFFACVSCFLFFHVFSFFRCHAVSSRSLGLEEWESASPAATHRLQLFFSASERTRESSRSQEDTLATRAVLRHPGKRNATRRKELPYPTMPCRRVLCVSCSAGHTAVKIPEPRGKMRKLVLAVDNVLPATSASRRKPIPFTGRVFLLCLELAQLVRLTESTSAVDNVLCLDLAARGQVPASKCENPLQRGPPESDLLGCHQCSSYHTFHS